MTLQIIEAIVHNKLNNNVAAIRKHLRSEFKKDLNDQQIRLLLRTVKISEDKGAIKAGTLAYEGEALLFNVTIEKASSEELLALAKRLWK